MGEFKKGDKVLVEVEVVCGGHSHDDLWVRNEGDRDQFLVHLEDCKPADDEQPAIAQLQKHIADLKSLCETQELRLKEFEAGPDWKGTLKYLIHQSGMPIAVGIIDEQYEVLIRECGVERYLYKVWVSGRINEQYEEFEDFDEAIIAALALCRKGTER